jgi:hypothetical protein
MNVGLVSVKILFHVNDIKTKNVLSVGTITTSNCEATIERS